MTRLPFLYLGAGKRTASRGRLYLAAWPFRSPMIVLATIALLALAGTYHRLSSVSYGRSATSAHSSGVYLEFDLVAADDGIWHHRGKLWLMDGRLRIDEMVEEAAEVGWASHVWIGGADAAFVNVMHRDKKYFRSTPEQFFGPDEPDTGPDHVPGYVPAREASEMLLALRTGSTKAVGPWNTFEVEIREPGPEEERRRVSEKAVQIIRRERRLLMLSMSEQPEVDLHTFSVLLCSAIDWYLARSGAESSLFRALTAISEGRVQDLPAGFPVQVAFPDSETVFFVRLVEFRPIDASVFDIPSDYEEITPVRRHPPTQVSVEGRARPQLYPLPWPRPFISFRPQRHHRVEASGAPGR